MNKENEDHKKRHAIDRRLFLLAGLQVIWIKNAFGKTSSDRLALSGTRFLENQQNIQLLDIISPDQNALLPKARQYSEQARGLLQTILVRSDLVVELDNEQTRWGDFLARLILTQGEILRGEELLLKRGGARVNAVSDNHEIIQTYLIGEEEARREKRGLWRVPYYRVRDANTLSDLRDCPGAFHVFVGEVKQVTATRSRTYLNFGDDYRSDFTATIKTRQVREWLKQDFDLAALEAKRIRVRGFVEWINGPSITIENKMNIEIL